MKFFLIMPLIKVVFSKKTQLRGHDFMEIERKFLIKELPDNLSDYPHQSYVQGYLCTEPVVRVRCEGDKYVLTYKGSGLMCREEYNLPLSKEAFERLIKKCDGIIINKTRYKIPLDSPLKYNSSEITSEPASSGLIAELDIFGGVYAGLMMVEVEFKTVDAANSFIPPDWFGLEVTNDSNYHNSNLSKGLKNVSELIK